MNFTFSTVVIVCVSGSAVLLDELPPGAETTETSGVLHRPLAVRVGGRQNLRARDDDLHV